MFFFFFLHLSSTSRSLHTSIAYFTFTVVDTLVRETRINTNSLFTVIVCHSNAVCFPFIKYTYVVFLFLFLTCIKYFIYFFSFYLKEKQLFILKLSIFRKHTRKRVNITISFIVCHIICYMYSYVRIHIYLLLLLLL